MGSRPWYKGVKILAHSIFDGYTKDGVRKVRLKLKGPRDVGESVML